MPTNSYRPSDPVARFYLSSTKGKASTPLDMKAPMCNVELVSWDTGPQNGSASITLYLGNGINQDGQSLTNIASGPTLENNYSQSATDINDLIAQMRTGWVKIYCPSASAPQSKTQTGDVQTVRQNLPDSSTDNPPADQVMIFAGPIWSVQPFYGNYHTVLHISAVDMGGWLSRQKFDYFPMKTIVPGDDPLYNIIPNSCLPDFNERLNAQMSPNKDGSIDYTSNLSIELPDFTVDLKMQAFEGYDLATAEGSQYRVYWHDLDVVQTVFKYIGSAQATLLQNLGITFSFTDQTGNLGVGVNTYSARNNLWQLLNKVCDRQKGLVLSLTYGGTPDATTVTLVCSLQSDTALNGYSPATTWNFTYGTSQAPAFYAEPPQIEFIDNDSGGYVRVVTDPVNLIYTFNLFDQFYEGWDTTQTPDETTIQNGGIYANWYSRFVIWTSKLYKMIGSGVKPDSEFAAESWTSSSTPLGVKFKTTTTTDSHGTQTSTTTLDHLNSIQTAEYCPYDETVKITENIPLANLNPNTPQGSVNSPIIFFYSNGPDNAEAVQDLNVRFQNGTMTLNPPSDDVMRYSDRSALVNLYTTLQVEGLPPLYVVTSKNGTYYNADSSYTEILYQFKPTVVLNNTISGIDENGIPQMITNNTADIGWLRGTDGMTVQNLYNDMLRVGTFYARQKNKCTFSITYIDPTNHLGSWLASIDVPAIVGSGGAIQGIGDESFTTLAANSVITKTVFNFRNQTTTYYSDWSNFQVGGKR